MPRPSGGYAAGYVTPVLSSNAAVGVWTPRDLYANRVAGTWPVEGTATPAYAAAGYTRLWGLTTKSSGLVTGTAATDTGSYDVKWWDGTISNYSSGATFSKAAAGGYRAFEIYPTSTTTPNTAGGTFALIGAATSSTTQSKFGGASGFFNTGYADGGTSSGYTLGTGDFTVEAFVFPTETTQSSDLGAVIDTRNAGAGSGLVLWRGTNNKWTVYLSASGNSLQLVIESTASVSLNQWQHIAAVRTGSNLRLFVNGVHQGTGDCSGYNLTGSRAYIATAADSPGATRLLRGYIDDLRIVKGTAIYTGTTTFTPPTSALTAVSGTSLLLHFDTAATGPSGGFDGFDVSGNEITSLRAESVVLASAPGYYQYGYQTGTYPYYGYVPGQYIPGPMEQGNLANNSLNAAALDQFYSDLLSGSGALYVAGNTGIATDTPSIATTKGYTVYGSVPP